MNGPTKTKSFSSVHVIISQIHQDIVAEATLIMLRMAFKQKRELTRNPQNQRRSSEDLEAVADVSRQTFSSAQLKVQRISLLH